MGRLRELRLGDRLVYTYVSNFQKLPASKGTCQTRTLTASRACAASSRSGRGLGEGEPAPPPTKSVVCCGGQVAVPKGSFNISDIDSAPAGSVTKRRLTSLQLRHYNSGFKSNLCGLGSSSGVVSPTKHARDAALQRCLHAVVVRRGSRQPLACRTTVGLPPATYGCEKELTVC